MTESTVFVLTKENREDALVYSTKILDSGTRAKASLSRLPVITTKTREGTSCRTPEGISVYDKHVALSIACAGSFTFFDDLRGRREKTDSCCSMVFLSRRRD